MEVEVRFPQLDELLTKIDAIDKKLDALTLAPAAPGPVQLEQMDLSLTTDAPKNEEPKAKRGRRRKAELISTTTVATAVVHGNGEDHGEAAEDQDDEDTLRARVAFEARRVQRTFGIGGMRATLKKVAGDGVLQIDDVPTWQLMQLLDALQAM